jgi:hypothetical protein
MSSLDRNRSRTLTASFILLAELMPSGLSMFSTLQAMALAEPLQDGPFVPNVLYDGDIADTAALERWIVTLATAP